MLRVTVLLKYIWPQNTFERINCFFLILCAVLFAYFIPVNGGIDHALSLPWVDATGHYYLRENHYLVKIGHEFLKNIVVGIAVIHLGILIASFWKPKLVQLRKISIFVILAMLASVAIIGLLKSTSSHACPWSIIQLHDHVVMWDKILPKKGACFPGGHASAGFSLIALYFAYRDRFPLLAKIFLIFALVMGAVMSEVQMVRGAHFLSHNFWAFWWSWCIDFFLYKWFVADTLHLKILGKQPSEDYPNKITG